MQTCRLGSWCGETVASITALLSHQMTWRARMKNQWSCLCLVRPLVGLLFGQIPDASFLLLSRRLSISVHRITMGVRAMQNSPCSTVTIALHLVQSFTPRQSGWQMLPNQNSNVYTHTAHTLHRRKWLQKVRGYGKAEPLFLRDKTKKLAAKWTLETESFNSRHPEDIRSCDFCSPHPTLVTCEDVKSTVECVSLGDVFVCLITLVQLEVQIHGHPNQVWAGAATNRTYPLWSVCLALFLLSSLE